MATTPAKKTSTPKTPTKKQTAKKAAPSKATTKAGTPNTPPVEQATPIAGDQLAMLLVLARDVVDTSIGIPFVLQARLSDTPTFDLDNLKSIVDEAVARLTSAPSVDLDAVKAFFDEAKGEGNARTTALQGTLEPVIGNAAQLPIQLSGLIENGRAKLRTLIAA